MFPNGYNMPFYSSYGSPNIGMGIGNIGAMSRGGGLLSKLGLARGASGGLKAFNWGGLLNNASRTLGVINQAIPLVKQVGPIYNNMKSMLKVASLFKDETDPVTKNNNSIISNNDSNDNTEIKKENTTINNNYSNSPNFFI